MFFIRRRQYSDEVRDVLNDPPSWMMRWGSAAVLFMLLFLFMLTYLFKYPDIIVAEGTLNSSNPPISLVAKVNGRMDRIFVNEGQDVKVDDPLISIENAANYKDVEKLKLNINLLKKDLLDSLWTKNVELGGYATLGSLQNTYASLTEDYSSYCSLKTSNFYKDKIKSREKQYHLHSTYYKNLINQNRVLKEEFLLAFKQRQRDSVLFNSKVISEIDFENSSRIYLQRLYNLKVAETTLTTTKINLEELNNGTIDLQEVYYKESEQLRRTIIKKIDILLSEITIWESLYLIKSPISGSVSMTRYFTNGINLTGGEPIITVIPRDTSIFFVQAETSVHNSGKLEPGLKVNIKLNNYSYYEYGFLRGTLVGISKVSENNKYYLKIKLDGYQTSLKIRLPLKHRMSGLVEIVTKDKKVIERIVEPILAMFE